MTEERERFNVTLTCPDCGQTGYAIWEETGEFDPIASARRSLVFLSGSFHPETHRTRTGGVLIVCNACDTIQPD